MTKDSLLRDIINCAKCRKDEISINLCANHSIEWSYLKSKESDYNTIKIEALKEYMEHG